MHRRFGIRFLVYHRIMPWVRRHLFRFLNQLFPKDKTRWVFHSRPVGYRDNARAFYEYVSLRAPKIKTIWLVDTRTEVDVLQHRGVPALYWRSLGGLWWLFRAGVIFTTHSGFVDLKVRRQRLVNLWHGMPIKAIGFTQTTKVDKRVQRGHERKLGRVDHWVATSPLTRLVISSSFGARSAQIGITGQPRTDRLFQNDNSSRNTLHQYFDIGPRERLILWTPTFRKPSSGLRDDGDDLSELLKAEGSLAILNDVLNRGEAHLIIKTHQYEEWEGIQKDRFKRIHLISDAGLGELGMELHDVLASTVVLITDYSSIFVDYLLLDRPLIFFVPDLETYRKQRGFLLEPYESWTPGPKIDSWEGLTEHLEQLFRGDDPYKEARHRLRPLYHTHVDEKSCERTFEWLMRGDIHVGDRK